LILAASGELLGQERSFELSLHAAPGASYSELDGFDFDLGLGLGFGWWLSESWALDLRAFRFDGDQRFAETSIDVLEAGARRHFALDSSWRPFVSFGAHYQDEEVERDVFCVQAPCPRQRSDTSALGLFGGGGVDWYFTERAALRLEGRAAFYDSDLSGDKESSFQATVGVVFRP
jgi:hypothetical protein